MNSEALARCRQCEIARLPPDSRNQCRVLVRSAAKIRECNIGDNSLACDIALAGPNWHAPSIRDTIHDSVPLKPYNYGLKRCSFISNPK